MKVLFGMNITENKKDPEIWGDELVVQTLPALQAEALQREIDKQENKEEHLKLPKPLRWIKNGALAVACFLLGCIIRALADTSLEEMLQDAPWLFYIVLGLGLIWGILELAQWARKKRLDSPEDNRAAQARLQSMIKAAYTTLGVPADAETVDILTTRFKVKKGRVMLKGLPTTTFVNPELRAFTLDGTLYLANSDTKYAIPLSNISGFEKINRRVSTSGWNKEHYITEEPYKSHKMETTKYGISFKPYYALVFQHEDQQWKLFIPPYELSTFEHLVGIEARTGLFS